MQRGRPRHSPAGGLRKWRDWLLEREVAPAPVHEDGPRVHPSEVVVTRSTVTGVTKIPVVPKPPVCHPLVVPLGPAHDAVSAFSTAGGEVEYALVSRRGGEPAAWHRAAAVIALEEIALQWERYADATSVTTGIPREEFGAHTAEPDRAVGARIDVRAFVGRAFDWEAQRIIRARQEWEGDFLTDGYAEAFYDPPHGISADLHLINEWFDAINHHVMGGLDDHLEVWSWSTDWAGWFDPGHEWWGAFLWTVDRPGLPWITAIAASSTD